MSNEENTEPLLETASESFEELPQAMTSGLHPTTEIQSQHASHEEAEDLLSHGSRSQSTDSSTDEQKLIKRLHASAPPSRDHPSPFIEYDSLNGAPFRMLKADTWFHLHAFSEDGELFAAGGVEESTRVWRRSDYTLLGMKKDRHIHVAMSFVDGKSDVLRVAENQPGEGFYIVDLKVRRSDKESNPAPKSLEDNLEITRIIRPIIPFNRYPDAKFSDDGSILLIHCHPSIKVYKVQSGTPLRYDNTDFKEIELTIPNDEIEWYCADISPNGQSVSVYCDKLFIDSSEEENKFIALWPELQFDGDAPSDPVIISGQRLVWTAAGEYLAVWDVKEPVLSVYKITRNDVECIATKTLQSGLRLWQAIGRKWSDCSLLLRESNEYFKERYIEWDFKEDVVTNEIFMDRKTEKTSSQTWRANPQEARDIHPSCAEDGIDLIGSMATNGSCAVVSRCSGATVFNITLPEDVNMNWEETTVALDRSGGHFLIIGVCYIFAFAPASLQHEGSWQSSTLQFPEDAMWNNEDEWRPFSQLGNHALSEVCNDNGRWKRFWGNSASTKDQIAASSNGRWCACFKDMSWMEAPERVLIGGKDYIACIVNLRNGHDDESYWKGDVDIIHNTDDYHYVFLSPNDDGTDRVVFVNMHDSPKLHAFDVDNQLKRGDRMDVSLDIEECLHVCQTRDQKGLVILERKAVCLFDLKKLSVQERIPYQTDFSEVTKGLKKDADSPYWWTRRRFRRSVSDDGSTVLLGWDVKKRRSILVTPKTKQQECEVAIVESGEGLSVFCQLTEDGDHTLFTDVDEISNGKIVIGIFSNKDLEVRRRICHAKDIFLRARQGKLDVSLDEICVKLKILDKLNLFYGISRDGSEFYVFIAFSNFLYDHCNTDLGIENKKRYTIYGTEECIPDYNRLIRSFNGTTSEKVHWLVDNFGPEHVFTYPVSKGLSIFQEAFLKGDRAMVKDIVDLAKRKRFELASRCVHKDLLTESVNRGVVQNVEQALDFKVSDQCVVKERLMMTSRDITNAMRLASHRVTKALQEDEFVVKLCDIEVHTSFLDPAIRRDKGVNIGTTDEILNWKLNDNEEILSQKWRDDHSDIVGEMEKDGDQSKTTASMKVLCIDGAARPGPLGLVRHLLLHGIPADVFKSRAVKWIVSWKWFKIWKPKFIQQFMWHVAFLGILTAYIILLGRSSDLVETDESIKISTSVLLFSLVGYGVLMTMDEKRELMSLVNEGRHSNQSKWKGVRYYFSSKWNWVDTALCVMLVVLMPLFHILSLFFTEINPVLSAVVAFVVLFSYIKVWYYAQPFRVTGALVLMIENIIRDCLPFLGLVSIMLIGFGLAIHVMLRSVIHRRDEDVNDAFGSFSKGTLTLFYALLGDFDSEVYAVNHELKFLVIITFGIYMIIQVIVLLNLLIAIMGDTFDRVKSNEEGQMLMARAMIIDSCEASATKSEREEIERLTGRYIYAVESTDEDAEDTAPGWWTGKFNMMIEKLKAIISKNKDHTDSIVKEKVKALGNEMKEDVKALGNEMRDNAAALSTEMKDLNTKTKQQEQRIAAIEQQLHQLMTEQASTKSSLASAISDAETRNEHRLENLSTKIDRLISLQTQEDA